MSLAEIGYRIRRSLGEPVRRWRDGRDRIPAVDGDPLEIARGPLCLGDDFPKATAEDLAAAERVVAGKRDIFRLREVQVGMEPEWNRDPLTGTLAPESYGPTIDYRNCRLVGDIKYTWELNRHLELVTLAQAYNTTREIRFAGAIKQFLSSWFEQCPYPLGVNWCSSLELAIRVINWAVAWQLVGGGSSRLFQLPGGRELRDEWLRSVYRHLAFIHARPSRYSSANNHLIGELAGLFVGACCWPLWGEVRKWGAQAGRGLQQEALVQNSTDGVNREQAIGYQQFVLDFLIIAGLVAERSQQSFADPYWRRVEKMMEFMAAVMDSAGNMPMIGDADDGRVALLSHEPDFSPYRSLLATGAVLFERSDFARKAGSCDQKTRWLLGERRSAGVEALLSEHGESAIPRAFPEGGYYILGCDWDGPREIRAVADVGPLGYLSIAAHGHADALHFTLSVDGREILIDPGTYAYHAQREWRDYFRGSSAHNTVVVDGTDQSVSGGPFMWLEHANSRCEQWVCEPGQDVLVGKHDGYRRLSDPLVHRRSLTLEKKRRLLVVKDSFECGGTHRAELWWHFSERCEVQIVGNRIVVRNGETVVSMTVTGDVRLAEFSGDKTRPTGWISRGYDSKIPTTSVCCSGLVSGTTWLRTEIACGAMDGKALVDGKKTDDSFVMPPA